MNNDIIQFYENKGYIFYDISSNIKSFNDYMKYYNYSRKNYDKLITIINLSSYFNKKNKITNFYRKGINLFLRWIIYKTQKVIKNDVYNENTIVLFYKKKFFITTIKCINIHSSDIQNILLNEYYECNICFSTNYKHLYGCKHCSLLVCYECKLKLNAMSNSCCCCKQ
jgi:hypothetical protein